MVFCLLSQIHKVGEKKNIHFILILYLKCVFFLSGYLYFYIFIVLLRNVCKLQNVPFSSFEYNNYEIIL